LEKYAIVMGRNLFENPITPEKSMKEGKISKFEVLF